MVILKAACFHCVQDTKM